MIITASARAGVDQRGHPVQIGATGGIRTRAHGVETHCSTPELRSREIGAATGIRTRLSALARQCNHSYTIAAHGWQDSNLRDAGFGDQCLKPLGDTRSELVLLPKESHHSLRRIYIARGREVNSIINQFSKPLV